MARSRPSTLLVSGDLPRRTQQPVALPIHQTTTWIIDDALNEAMARGDYRSEYLYSRMGNPTVRALEEKLAALHGAEDCVCAASGMGAISTFLFSATAPGDTILAAHQLYGATSTLLDRYLAPAGRKIARGDLSDAASVARLLDAHRPAWVLGETVSNPLVQVLPIDALCTAARARGARVAIDNTFANPILCRPLELGADAVVESLSKSIAGHSDVHGGAVLGARSLVEPAWHAMVHLGPCLDPHAAGLIWRGLQTLELRTAAMCRNAETVAAALRAHPQVERVYFPAGPSPTPAAAGDGRTGGGTETAGAEGGRHARPTLARPGSMLAFVVRGGDARALRFLAELRIVRAASSLGGVESLASLPFNTSHRTPESRAQIGLLPGTIRLSVGCEDPSDLIDDLSAAFRATG